MPVFTAQTDKICCHRFYKKRKKATNKFCLLAGRYAQKEVMRKVSSLIVFLFICGCSSGSSEDKELRSTSLGFEARQDIDATDLEGLWVNACIESTEPNGAYQREFIEYKSGASFGNESDISVGQMFFSDANCIDSPEIDPNDVMPIISGRSASFTPVGLYTDKQGITSKVLEFASNFDGGDHLAYKVLNETLYYAFGQNSEFDIDYDDTYQHAE